MDLFGEFNAIVRALQGTPIRYAIVGALAVAVHGGARSTKDMDFLVHPDDLEAFARLLAEEGYLRKSPGWTFQKSGLTLHRFIKPLEESEDFHMADVLLANDERHRGIIERAQVEPWGDGGLRVAARNDLIAMKKEAGRHRDLADVDILEGRGNENEPG
jgi:hypothetical protein